MTCTRVSDESLVGLLFDAGSADDRAHVAGCADCGGRLHALEATLVQVAPPSCRAVAVLLEQAAAGRTRPDQPDPKLALGAPGRSSGVAGVCPRGRIGNRTAAVPGERALRPG